MAQYASLSRIAVLLSSCRKTKNVRCRLNTNQSTNESAAKTKCSLLPSSLLISVVLNVISINSKRPLETKHLRKGQLKASDCSSGRLIKGSGTIVLDNEQKNKLDDPIVRATTHLQL